MEELQRQNAHLDFFTPFINDPKNMKSIKDIDNKNFGNIENLTAYRTLSGRCEIAFGDKDKKLVIYDLETGKDRRYPTGHTDDVNRVKYYRDELRQRDILITSSADSSLKVWDIYGNEPQLLLTVGNSNDGNNNPICILFDNLRTYVVAGTFFKLKAYPMTGREPIDIDCKCKKYHIVEPFYYGKNTYLIILSMPGVYLYNWQTKSVEKTLIDKDDTHQHWCFSLNHKGNSIEIIEADSKGKIRIWDLFQGTLKKTITNGGNDPWPYTMSLWNSRNLFIGDENHSIKLYDLESGNCVKEWKEHQDYINAIKKIRDFNNNEYIVSCCETGTKLWKI